MKDISHTICPAEKAGTLDSPIRRFFQNPKKIVGPFLKEGMTVLDIGCGPGFFSLDMAKIVGDSGQVIACDVQKQMLEKLKRKIKGSTLEKRITVHQCSGEHLGIEQAVDFALAFYMVHEVANQEVFFREIGSILKNSGKLLIVEPPFHVTSKTFRQSLKTATRFGFRAVARPKIFLSKTELLEKISCSDKILS